MERDPQTAEAGNRRLPQSASPTDSVSGEEQNSQLEAELNTDYRGLFTQQPAAGTTVPIAIRPIVLLLFECFFFLQCSADGRCY